MNARQGVSGDNRMFQRIGQLVRPEIPNGIRDRLALQQSERLHAFLPMLCILVAANALAMAWAILGDLPWWQQAAPPAIIITSCLAVLAISRLRGRPQTADAARRQHGRAAWVAGGLGVVAGLWCINAFTETEQYYCMTAPVFTGIAAIVCASCLLSVPRAAIAAMAGALVPIVIKLSMYDYDSLRAMSLMLALVSIMQAGVVMAKHRETIATLTLEAKLAHMASVDALTGLDNRAAFEQHLQDELDRGARVVVALADLDGFKPVNDAHGHRAGDAVLVEMAKRMRMLSPSALSVARLGGDEFALLFPGTPDGVAKGEIAALRQTLGLPIGHDGLTLSVGCSIGTAASGAADGTHMGSLLHTADMRLYAEKENAPGRRRHGRRGADAPTTRVTVTPSGDDADAVTF